MKFKITFKTPEATQWTMLDIEKQSLSRYDKNNLLLDAKTLVEEYIQYDEYVTLEFDTETKSVQVMKVGK